MLEARKEDFLGIGTSTIRPTINYNNHRLLLDQLLPFEK